MTTIPPRPTASGRPQPTINIKTDRPGGGPKPAGLVSVVVPCFGQLELVRLCAPRLMRHSPGAVEFLFADAGSLDGTADYLAGLADASQARVRVLRLEGDVDLPAACAAAAAHAHGDLVVLLSSDTVVPEGWLGRLTSLARMDPGVGMVGAMSNLAPPPQWVGKLPYRLKPKTTENTDNGVPAACSAPDLEAVDTFARQWGDTRRGQWFEAERLGGPCLLLKAEVLRKIDLAGAGNRLGALDGDLLSQRVRQAGHRLACCQDVFLHHFGSRLFAALRIDTTGQFQPPPGSPVQTMTRSA
jgi:GT2 family glycosyltransferase